VYVSNQRICQETQDLAPPASVKQAFLSVFDLLIWAVNAKISRRGVMQAQCAQKFVIYWHMLSNLGISIKQLSTPLSARLFMLTNTVRNILGDAEVAMQGRSSFSPRTFQVFQNEHWKLLAHGDEVLQLLGGEAAVIFQGTQSGFVPQGAWALLG
jgi:hypothetical protein